MKAKEYFQKLKDIESSEGFDKAVSDVYIQMALDIQKECAVRNVKFDRGLLAVIKEMNDRWNAMRKFDSRLMRDGFRRCMMSNLLKDANLPKAPDPSNQKDENVDWGHDMSQKPKGYK